MYLRRRIHRSEGLGLAGAGVASALAGAGANTDPQLIAKKKTLDFDGLKVGMTSYSTRKLSVDETIACCRSVGIQYIALKDAHLKLTSTAEQRAATRKKFSDSGIQIVGCGVIYLKNDEDEIRRAFEYARDIGASTAGIGVNPETMPAVSRGIRDFDLHAAIHKQGPQAKLGASRPLSVMEWQAIA